jgi:hypothetical protein
MCRASHQLQKELNRAGTRKKAATNRPLLTRSNQQLQDVERPRMYSGAALFCLTN